LKFSFLLLEYCKIRECYAVANAFTIRNMHSLFLYMKCNSRKINRPTILHQNRKLSSRISLQNQLFCLCRLPAVILYSWIFTRFLIIFKIYGIHVVINYFPYQQIHENFLTTVTICCSDLTSEFVMFLAMKCYDLSVKKVGFF
jgi:hypothetical protein